MREQALAEGRSPRYDGRWRDRDPAEAPPGVAPVDPAEGAARWRHRGRGPRAGHRARRQRRAGRHDHPAQRRHADLQPLGGGGRPRHGHHPCHPRRRPPDQHVPPGADLPGDGLGPAALRAYPADPRRRRRQAVEAARRRVGAGVPRAGLSARGAVQLPAAPRLGAWRRRGDRPRRGDPAVRPRRRRPRAEPDGLRQAHQPERHLYPPGRRRAADPRGAGAAGASHRPGARRRGGASASAR